MKTAVWDTYVKKKDGTVMHFDIVVPEDLKNEETILGFGKEFLKAKNQEGQVLTSKESRFCHIEPAKPAAQADIKEIGYHIVEMEGC